MDGKEIADIALKAGLETGIAESLKAGLAAVFGKNKQVIDAVERDLVSSGYKEPQSLFVTVLGMIRMEGAARALTRYRRVLDELGIPERELPPKLFLPMLEEAAGESDDYLQDKWARLMAAATREDADKRPIRLYVEKLKQLDPVEARLLDYLYRHKLWAVGGENLNPTPESVASDLSIDEPTLSAILDHLRGLQLLVTTNAFRLSHLGYSFVRTCRGEPAG